MAKKPGKYDHVTQKLKKMPGVSTEGINDPRYQDRVETVKAGIKSPPTDEDPATDPSDAARCRAAAEVNMKGAIAAFMRQCAGKPYASSYGAAYAGLRDLKDVIKSWESNVNLLIEAYAQLWSDQSDNEGLTAMTIGDRPISKWLEPYSTVKDKQATLAWAMRECEYCYKPKSEHKLVDDMFLKGTHVEKQLAADGVTVVEVQVEHFFAANELRKSLALPWQTLDSLVRQKLLNGEDLPPGVEVYAKTKIRLGSE